MAAGDQEPTSETSVEEWLVIEWRDGEAVPGRFYLMSLPEDTSRTVAGADAQGALSDGTRCPRSATAVRP